jgi:hypothetical protein
MDHVLLHCHLFKNAGTTIDWALKRSLGWGFVDHRRDRTMIRGGMRYIEKYLALRGYVMAVSSHHMPFDPAFESRRFHCWHIIMLRHPIARCASVYQYEKIQPAVSLGAKMAKKLDMRGYFAWRMQDDAPVVIKDFHTRYLAGRKNPARRLRDEDFDSALLHARSPKVLIGFVERFDESMVLFESVLKNNFRKLDLAYIKQNQNHARPEDAIAYLHDELGDDLFLRLNSANALDGRLYEMLGAEFDNRIAGLGDFDQRLVDFRRRCASLHA